MKILVMGGMHGNEPLGIEIVRILQKRRAAGIDAALANEQAVEASMRFTGADLNRSFPGSASGVGYETRRAAAIVQLCGNYDLVLDFHNTHCPNNDCTFVGATADPLLLNVSSWLGLKRVIVADYDCVNKYASNCISIEISLSSARMDAQAWVDVIEKLAAIPTLPPADSLELFRFVYRMTLEDKERLELDKRGLQAFTPLPAALVGKLGVASPAYPIFIADAYTPYNFGGLLNRLEV